MAELSDATKAPATITVDGKEWRLSPLEIRDFGEVERWLEVLPFERTRRKIAALGEVATPELIQKMLAAAEAESKSMGLASIGTAGESDDAVTRALNSLEGVQLLFYLSVRKAHPEVTREAASGLMQAEIIDDVRGVLDRVSGLDADDAGADRPTDEVESP